MKRTIKTLSFILSMLLLFSLFTPCAMAYGDTSQKKPEILYSGLCGMNANFTVTDDGTLRISGSGSTGYGWYDFDEYSEDDVHWGDIYCKHNNLIKKVVIEEGITAIREDAFANFYAMTEVSIPSTLVSIEAGAFRGCRAMTNIIIPENIEEIGNHIFWNCSALTEVIYNSGAPVSKDMFEGCSSLKNITFNNDISEIKDNAFLDCTSLADISLPETIQRIGQSAFYGCTSLTDISLPETIQQIGQSAFYGCSSLESIELPKAMTYISENLFRDCSKLKTIIMPAITKIAANAFNGCNALKDIYYPGNKEAWNKLSVGTGNDVLFTAKLQTYHNYNYIPFCTITTKYTKYGYTGKEIRPVVTVSTVSGTKLKKGTNYIVSYKNNVDCGTATITVTGTGKYKGEQIYTFQIRPAKLKNVKATKISGNMSTVTWTGDKAAEKYSVGYYYSTIGYTTKTSYTLKNLKAGKTYKIYVRSIMTGKDENGNTVTFYGNPVLVNIS